MANRFWVGGSGTWDAVSTANWSATSGGAAGATAPTLLDAVFFDSLSGSGTCTTASGSICTGATFDTSTINLVFGANHTQSSTFVLTSGAINLNNNILTCLALTGSNLNVKSIAFGTGKIVLTGNNAIILELSIANSFTYTGTPTIEANYSGAVGTRTLRFGRSSGGTEANAISLNITGGTDIVTLTNNDVFKNLNFTGFAGTHTNQTLNLYGNLTISSGMTLSAGTAVTSFLATSGTQQITTANKTFDFPLTFNGVGGTFAFQDAVTQGSTRAFTITNGTVQLKAGVTSTVGSLTTSSTNQKFLQSTLAGTQATLSQVTGTVSVGYLTIKDINATGGATFNAFTVNSNVNAGNNLGWDFFAQLGKTIFTRRKEKRVLI
jgi:hypothetical protein